MAAPPGAAIALFILRHEAEVQEVDAFCGEVSDGRLDVTDLPAKDGVLRRSKCGGLCDTQHHPVGAYAKDRCELVVAFKNETGSVLVELLGSGCVGRWVVGMKPKGDEA